MQIGILTYHRSHNYGALLQAIALRHVIDELGYKVSFVDYWPEYHKELYSMINKSIFKKRTFINKIILGIAVGILFPIKYCRYKKFIKFINQNIVPFCRPASYFWNIIVCGSDQIWRKQEGLGGNFNPEYYGAGFIKSNSYMSYAASMGIVDVNSSELSIITEWIKHLKKVSVRENSLRDLLIHVGIPDVVTVLDPTLLLSKSSWETLIHISYQKTKDKYILIYELSGESFNREAIRAFAKQRGCDVKVLRGSASFESYLKNTITIADPFDMVNLIANAEFVFTSSYHGLVFSIIFEKQVIASFKNNSDRAKSLLESIGYPQRLIPARSDIFPTDVMDYSKVRDKLEILRNSSITWLKTSLSYISNMLKDPENIPNS